MSAGIDEEIVDEFGGIDPDDYGRVDLTVTAQVVADAVTAVKTVVERHANAVINDFEGLDEDERVLAELIEENLDTRPAEVRGVPRHRGLARR